MMKHSITPNKINILSKFSSKISELTNLIFLILFLAKFLPAIKDSIVGSNANTLLLVPIAKFDS